MIIAHILLLWEGVEYQILFLCIGFLSSLWCLYKGFWFIILSMKFLTWRLLYCNGMPSLAIKNTQIMYSIEQFSIIWTAFVLLCISTLFIVQCSVITMYNSRIFTVTLSRCTFQCTAKALLFSATQGPFLKILTFQMRFDVHFD